jgi:hypothetical protein
MRLRKPQRIYLYTVCVWVLAVITHAYLHIASVMSGPPSADLYANSLGFQIIAFALTWFLVWMLVLMFLLVVEFTIFGRKFNSVLDPDVSARRSTYR